MTTAELMTRAQNAINTNQPRLAQLYMRQALAQTDEHRRELNPQAYAFRQAQRSFQAFADQLERFAWEMSGVLMNAADNFARAFGGAK